MLSIVCVLKTGGDYTSDYVVKLYSACSRHIKEPFCFICLSDDEEVKGLKGINFLDLEFGYPGWWSKFEIFKIPGEVIFFDLDTVIMGDLTDMVRLVRSLKENEILGLSAFNLARNANEKTRFSSGVMGWNGNFEFVLKSLNFHSDSKNKRYCGDQDRIHEILRENGTQIKFWQKEMSGLYSYKRNCKKEIPQDAKVICFHGKPRPHEATHLPFVKENWK